MSKMKVKQHGRENSTLRNTYIISIRISIGQTIEKNFFVAISLIKLIPKTPKSKILGFYLLRRTTWNAPFESETKVKVPFYNP